MTHRRVSLARSIVAIPLLLAAALGCRAEKAPPRPAGNTTILSFSAVEDAWVYSRGRGVIVAVVDWQFDEDGRASDFYVSPATMIPGERIGDLEPWHGSWMVDIVHAIAPEASVMPIIGRSLRKGYAQALPAAIRYAADHGAAVVTSSMGPARDSRELREAVEYARARSCVFVNVHPELVIGESGRTRYCRRGECSESIIHAGVVAVPAHPVKPDDARDIYVWPYDLDSVYRDGWGFSNGPPAVGGVIALMKGANPSLSPEAIKRLLIESGDMKDGFRVLNARKAVAAAARFSPAR
ncbi:MAG TPA: hypothetical protein VFL80_09125 [Thermoanaerobaculia bacterium]|nr:hypothetical protein [Thermoanaerobaculia bacterium]